MIKNQKILMGVGEDEPPQPLPGPGATLGTGIGWYRENECGRKWLATCGCEMSSGWGAYGTPRRGRGVILGLGFFCGHLWWP